MLSETVHTIFHAIMTGMIGVVLYFVGRSHGEKAARNKSKGHQIRCK